MSGTPRRRPAPLATAYRYFPIQDDLLSEAILELAINALVDVGGYDRQTVLDTLHWAARGLTRPPGIGIDSMTVRGDRLVHGTLLFQVPLSRARGWPSRTMR